MRVKKRFPGFLAMIAVGMAMSVAVLPPPPLAASDVVVIARGDPMRAQLLNVARGVFQRATGGDVEFVVKRLATQNGWAFGHVVLQRPGGAKIKWRKTKFADALKDGMFDPAASFFLLQQTPSGWVVRAHAVGPTDLVWDGWRQDFNLSMDLFQAN